MNLKMWAKLCSIAACACPGLSALAQGPNPPPKTAAEKQQLLLGCVVHYASSQNPNLLITGKWKALPFDSKTISAKNPLRVPSVDNAYFAEAALYRWTGVIYESKDAHVKVYVKDKNNVVLGELRASLATAFPEDAQAYGEGFSMSAILPIPTHKVMEQTPDRLNIQCTSQQPRNQITD